MLIGKSIDAATSTGAGSPIWADTPKTSASIQVSFTGGPSGLVVRVDTTLDGVNWQASPDAFTIDGGSGDPSGKLAAVPAVAGPFIGLRANITTLSGGSSPTVDVWVAAA